MTSITKIHVDMHPMQSHSRATHGAVPIAQIAEAAIGALPRPTRQGYNMAADMSNAPSNRDDGPRTAPSNEVRNGRSNVPSNEVRNGSSNVPSNVPSNEVHMGDVYNMVQLSDDDADSDASWDAMGGGFSDDVDAGPDSGAATSTSNFEFLCISQLHATRRTRCGLLNVVHMADAHLRNPVARLVHVCMQPTLSAARAAEGKRRVVRCCRRI